MFEQLFTQPHALARHNAGPLPEERRRFLAHLAERGLPRKTLRADADWLLRIADTLRLARRPAENISRDEIKQKANDKRSGFISLATRWLQFLGRLEQVSVPANPYAEGSNPSPTICEMKEASQAQQ